MRSLRFFAQLLFLLTAVSAVSFAQVDTNRDGDGLGGRPVLWEQVDVSSQDLFAGPWAKGMAPNVRRVQFVKEEKGGYSKKYRIKDADGRTWLAKIGAEAQSETAAARLLSALGYKTEANYLVKRLTIPGKGTFTNVRLEARPEDVKRAGEWKWRKNPFLRTPELQGLKIMMVFINNWDMKDANNVVLRTQGEDQYAISDLGVSFGKTGFTKVPLLWWIGRTRNKPNDYAKSKFVTDATERGRLKLHFNGKNHQVLRDLTVADARWIANLLTQLSDRQIRDAFRAANYSQAEINTLTRAVRSRIRQLDLAGDGRVGSYR
jgi:hypothetical protein